MSGLLHSFPFWITSMKSEQYASALYDEVGDIVSEWVVLLVILSVEIISF